MNSVSPPVLYKMAWPLMAFFLLLGGAMVFFVLTYSQFSIAWATLFPLALLIWFVWPCLFVFSRLNATLIRATAHSEFLNFVLALFLYGFACFTAMCFGGWLGWFTWHPALIYGSALVWVSAAIWFACWSYWQKKLQAPSLKFGPIVSTLFCLILPLILLSFGILIVQIGLIHILPPHIAYLLSSLAPWLIWQRMAHGLIFFQDIAVVFCFPLLTFLFGMTSALKQKYQARNNKHRMRAPPSSSQHPRKISTTMFLVRFVGFSFALVMSCSAASWLTPLRIDGETHAFSRTIFPPPTPLQNTPHPYPRLRVPLAIESEIILPSTPLFFLYTQQSIAWLNWLAHLGTHQNSPFSLRYMLVDDPDPDAEPAINMQMHNQIDLPYQLRLEFVDTLQNWTLAFVRFLSDHQMRERPSIGIISGLPLAGGVAPYAPDPGYNLPENHLWRLLQEDFSLVTLPLRSESIDPDFDLIVLIHPRDFSARLLYAIDQYVVNGGQLVIFLDPFSLIEQQIYNQASLYLPLHSDLSLLLQHWGIGFDHDMIIMDQSVSNNGGGSAPNQEISLDTDIPQNTSANAFSVDLPAGWFRASLLANAELGLPDNILLAAAGALRIAPPEESAEILHYQPLAVPSLSGHMLIHSDILRYAGSIEPQTEAPHKTLSTDSEFSSEENSGENFGEDFGEDEPQQITERKLDREDYLALWLRGQFESAFLANHPAIRHPENHRNVTNHNSDVIIISDTDFLFDLVTESFRPALRTAPLADNHAFILSLFSHLTNRLIAGLQDTPTTESFAVWFILPSYDRFCCPRQLPSQNLSANNMAANNMESEEGYTPWGEASPASHIPDRLFSLIILIWPLMVFSLLLLMTIGMRWGQRLIA